MPYYLIQVTYSPEAFTSLVEKPEVRKSAARALLVKLAGSTEGFRYAFGDWDVLAIGNLPDNVSAEAVSMAVSRTDQFNALKAAPLVTVQETSRAMTKAGGLPFKAPGKPERYQEPATRFVTTATERGHDIALRSKVPRPLASRFFIRSCVHPNVNLNRNGLSITRSYSFHS